MTVDDFQKILCHEFPNFVEEGQEFTWHPKTDLCRGSYGRAILWVKTDKSDKIQDVSNRTMGLKLPVLVYEFRIPAANRNRESSQRMSILKDTQHGTLGRPSVTTTIKYHSK